MYVLKARVSSEDNTWKTLYCGDSHLACLWTKKRSKAAGRGFFIESNGIPPEYLNETYPEAGGFVSPVAPKHRSPLLSFYWMWQGVVVAVLRYVCVFLGGMWAVQMVELGVSALFFVMTAVDALRRVRAHGQ